MNLAAELARVADLRGARPSRARKGTGKGVIVAPLDKPRLKIDAPMWTFDVTPQPPRITGKRGGLPRSEHDRKYRENHAPEIRAQQDKWREENRSHVNAYSAMKNGQYRAADPERFRAAKRKAYWERKWLAAFLGYLGAVCR